MAKRKQKKLQKKIKIAESISIVAHQLKNPISVIKGFLEILIAGDCGKITPKQKEYLGDALENVEKMNKTIEDILDVSKIEQGSYGVKPEPVHLEEIAFKILVDLFPWAKANNCKIIFKRPKKFPQVMADPGKIEKVIENLISNAIKYNRAQGLIAVNVIMKSKLGKITLCCKDNGIGIPNEDSKKIFTKFYRSEDAIEVDPSGSGLGLFISKAIIESSGGKIWFTRNKGKGMTFCFSLPIIKN